MIFNSKIERDEFIEKNMKLVHYIIGKYFKHSQNKEDLFQVGCVELIRVTDNFDESLGNKFSTYAVMCIVNSIKRYIRNNIIKIPRSYFDKLVSGEIQEDEFKNRFTVSSLDFKLNSSNTEESNTAMGIVPGMADEYKFEEDDLLYEINEFIETINNKIHRDVFEEHIYELMYGVKVGQKYLGNKYKISQTQVSRIRSSYTKKLKEFLISRGYSL